MHTQLVSILERYRRAVDLHYFHRFLRYRVHAFESLARVSRRTSTETWNCNDHCELQSFSLSQLPYRPGRRIYLCNPVTRQCRGTTTLVSNEERTRELSGFLLRNATLAKESEHGDFAAADIVHRRANRQFLLLHHVTQYG
jgi:hypothetical protein